MTKHIPKKKKMHKVTKQPITTKCPKTIQPNYYLLVASVNSSMTDQPVYSYNTQQTQKRMCGKYK